MWLSSISVEGFRGIGPQSELLLSPQPGLTLVVGRNGSGKSSFVERLEALVTGDNLRWRDRPPVWREGWKKPASRRRSRDPRRAPSGGRQCAHRNNRLSCYRTLKAGTLDLDGFELDAMDTFHTGAEVRLSDLVPPLADEQVLIDAQRRAKSINRERADFQERSRAKVKPSLLAC